MIARLIRRFRAEPARPVPVPPEETAALIARVEAQRQWLRAQTERQERQQAAHQAKVAAARRAALKSWEEEDEEPLTFGRLAEVRRCSYCRRWYVDGRPQCRCEMED